MFQLSEYAQLFFPNLLIQFMTTSRSWLSEGEERGAEGEEVVFGYGKKVKDIYREEFEKMAILLKKITISRAHHGKSLGIGEEWEMGQTRVCVMQFGLVIFAP